MRRDDQLRVRARFRGRLRPSPRHAAAFAAAFGVVALVGQPSVAKVQDPSVGPDIRLERSLAAVEGADGSALRAFYGGREHRPFWPGDQDEATIAGGLLEAARDHGFALPDLAPSFAPDDLALTRLYLRLARLLHGGAIDPARLPNVEARPEPFDAAAALFRLDASASAIEALDAAAPPNPRYRAMQRRFADWRDRDAWRAPYSDDGVERERGARGPAIAAARARLAERGVLDPALARGDDRFDRPMRDAVQLFQRRNGLERTGRLDAPTRRALATPLDQLRDALALNMERLRWTPRDWGERRIEVDLPAQSTTLIEPGGRLRMRAMIGETGHQTPTFSGLMTYLVFNPYWNVPRSIVVEDFLPQLQQNWRWASVNEMEVFDRRGNRLAPQRVGWGRFHAGNLPVRLRQDPGPDNPLGKVKFMFPNPWAIYLHDTPYKRAFAAPDRAFSHGCVRVQDPSGLAAALLASNGWSRAQVDEAMASDRRRHVTLDQPVAVHILYATHWVDEDGALQVRADIYDRDRRLGDALARWAENFAY